MSIIVNNYPVFEDNQVLTSSQLNQMTNYLDQQNRLTRSTLIGIGVVCGLEISCDENPVTLTISKGVGITSEGHLITMGDCPTTLFRPYTLPNSVSYPPFTDPLTQLQDIELHELLTANAPTDTEEVITPLSKAFLTDKVVLLFLECFDNDLKSCLGKSCDELGIDRIINLRKLLISKTDIDKVMERTGGGKPDASFPGKFQLPDISIPRVLFNPLDPPSHNYAYYSLNYVGACKEPFTKIFKLLLASYEVYKPILVPVFGENPFTSVHINNLKDLWEKYFDQLDGLGLPLFGIQYFYDFVKDLILAYREFRQTAFDLISECCPDMSRFPKHLMLGEAIPLPPDICNPSLYRHLFTQPPIFNHQNYLREKTISLFKRLVMLFESFDLERVNAPKDLEVKVTPSCEKKSLLTDRSIPFYYDSKKASSYDSVGTLESEWSYDNRRQCSENQSLPAVSYDNHQIDQNLIGPIITPLDFDMDNYNFLRIEGHLGKELFGVIETLETLKRRKNLSFDIRPVYLGDIIENGPRPECICADLQPIYSIWRNKILFFLSNIVTIGNDLEPLVTKREEIIKTVSEADLGAETLGSSQGFAASNEESWNPGLEKISAMLANIDRDNWYLSAEKFLRLTEDLRNIEKDASESNSSRFTNNTEKRIQQFLAEFNDCLRKLITSMKVDLKDFSLERWLERYKCPFKVVISLMKFIAGEVKNNDEQTAVLIILRVYCNLLRLLGTFAIYPYINIRVIADTFNYRLEKLGDSLKFSNFLKDRPGLEHKAGVAPGETLVLLYQLPHEINWKIAQSSAGGENIEDTVLIAGAGFSLGPQKFPLPSDTDFTPENLENIIKSLNGLIIGDFTLPYLCCDECANQPNVALPLAPLAVPHCGISLATFSQEQDSQIVTGYNPVQIQMFDNLYDPEIYAIRLNTDPKFGNAIFDQQPYEPDPTKQKQVLRYEVDITKVQQEMATNGDLFFVDEFEYEFYERNQQKAVDSSTITIFIPVYRNAVITAGTLLGQVATAGRGNNILLEGAIVKVMETDLTAKTNKSGNFRMPKVPLGEQTILTTAPGFIPKVIIIKITTGINNVNINMIPVIFDFPTDRFNGIFDVMGIAEDSVEATTVKGYYQEAFEISQREINEIVITEGATDESPLRSTLLAIKRFTEEEVTIVEINQEFVDQRDVLTKEISTVKDVTKKRYDQALQHLTFTYLNRLALLEPKRMSKTTKDILKDTATIFGSSNDIQMTTAMKAWRKKADNWISTNFAKNIDENFLI